MDTEEIDRLIEELFPLVDDGNGLDGDLIVLLCQKMTPSQLRLAIDEWRKFLKEENF